MVLNKEITKSKPTKVKRTATSSLKNTVIKATFEAQAPHSFFFSK